MASILYISEQPPEAVLGDPPHVGFTIEHGIPTVEDVLEAEFVLIVGSITNENKAKQIGGVLRLAAERGSPTVVVAYPGTLAHERSIINALAPCMAGDLPAHQAVESAHPTFREYLGIFGRSAVEFSALANDVEVLGRLEEHSEHPPAAWCRPVGASGTLYVLPYFLAGATGFRDALLQAVRDHHSGATGEVPAFLVDLRLATEPEVLANIERTETELDALKQEAARLARYRLLVGPLSGDAFEQLAIETLNEIFDGTDYRAEDREDLKKEDFWIVSDHGEQAPAAKQTVARGNCRVGKTRLLEQPQTRPRGLAEADIRRGAAGRQGQPRRQPRAKIVKRLRYFFSAARARG